MKGLCECGCGEATELIPYTQESRGWVKGEPFRFIRGHNSWGRFRTGYEIEDRGFDTPCWIWQGAKTELGYGQKRVAKRTWKAHRWYYEERHGPIPEGLPLDHLCRNPSCVNPDHLEPVSHAENVRRGNAAKLTLEKAVAIRESDERCVDLAAKYEVSASLISNIRAGRVWKVAA